MKFYIASGFFKCYRCGVLGLLGGSGNPSGQAPAPARGFSDYGGPEGWIPLWTPEASTSELLRPALRMLVRRGIEPDAWEGARLGACLTGRAANRVVVPLLEADGKTWWGWVGRSWAEQPEMRYRTADAMQRVQLFNGAMLVEQSPIAAGLVEGVFDALPYWPRCAAFLGKPDGQQLDWIAAHARRPVVVALDGDAWREGEMTAQLLLQRGVRAAWVQLPAAKDPNEVDPRWFLAQLDDAEIPDGADWLDVPSGAAGSAPGGVVE